MNEQDKELARSHSEYRIGGGDFCFTKAELGAFLAERDADKVRELEKDAARWRYFIDTCSSEMGYAICGHEDASNEQINEAIDQAMKEANQ